MAAEAARIELAAVGTAAAGVGPGVAHIEVVLGIGAAAGAAAGAAVV